MLLRSQNLLSQPFNVTFKGHSIMRQIAFSWKFGRRLKKVVLHYSSFIKLWKVWIFFFYFVCKTIYILFKMIDISYIRDWLLLYYIHQVNTTCYPRIWIVAYHWGNYVIWLEMLRGTSRHEEEETIT